MNQLDETLAEGAREVRRRLLAEELKRLLDKEQRARNIYWAERFEEEAAALERGPNEPMHPILLKARIDSCRAMAADLRKQVADAEKTPS